MDEKAKMSIKKKQLENAKKSLEAVQIVYYAYVFYTNLCIFLIISNFPTKTVGMISNKLCGKSCL